MFSNKQKLVFIVVTALVVGVIGMIFSSGRDKEEYDDKRYLGALGKRTNRDNTVWLNKAISFKKTTRETEPEIIEEQPELKPEPKKKEAKKDKKKAKKNAKKKDAEKKGPVMVRMGGGPVGEGAQSQDNTGAVANEDSPANNPVPAAPYAATGGGIMDPAATDNSMGFGNPTNNPDYWTSVLMDSPSLSNLEKLVDAYRSNSISDATFYSVVSNMLEDDNRLVRHYGLLSLSRTPSARSFRELVEFKNNSQYEGATSKVDRSLKLYTLYRHANVVNTVLEDEDANVKLEAIKIGKESAERSLASVDDTSKPEEEPESVDNMGRPVRELSSVKAAIDPAIYEEIAIKIESISRSEQDTQIINSAQDAHSSINKLLEQYKEE